MSGGAGKALKEGAAKEKPRKKRKSRKKGKKTRAKTQGRKQEVSWWKSIWNSEA